MNSKNQLTIIEALVLKKTVYSETSLIINTLTSDKGRQSFLIKGALRNRKSKNSFVDLFRYLQIVYKPSHSSELHAVREVDCIDSFYTISSNQQNFKIAIWLCQFILVNTEVDNSVPNLFQALKIAFHRLSQSGVITTIPIKLGICFIALSDHGLLPDFPDNKRYQLEVDRMMEFSLNIDIDVPDYPQESWGDLWQWMREFIRRNTEIKLPNE